MQQQDNKAAYNQPVTDEQPQKVTIIQHVASPGQVHVARLWGGAWVARCDAAAGWTVPLIHHPKRADLITCEQCRLLRMADLGAIREAEAFMERVRDGG